MTNVTPIKKMTGSMAYDKFYNSEKPFLLFGIADICPDCERVYPMIE